MEKYENWLKVGMHNVYVQLYWEKANQCVYNIKNSPVKEFCGDRVEMDFLCTCNKWAEVEA